MSLELGLLPVRFIIMLRRIRYVQHILKQRIKNTLKYQFLTDQVQNPKICDWFSKVKDLELLEIDLNIAEIEVLSTEKYKELCKTKVKKLAFLYLITKKNSHEKVRDIKYESLEMSEYLRANEFNMSVS